MSSTLEYLSGFGNSHSSEALAGTLPVGQNSPQRVARGLYAEKFSATAFTAPRHKNSRSWFYRIRPSVIHGEFTEVSSDLFRTAPDQDALLSPNQMRWDPLPLTSDGKDFVQGLTTIIVNGDAAAQRGLAIHLYNADRSMQDRFFYNADGEMLIVPEHGGLVLHTECGVLAIEPGEIAVIPRGMKFRVALTEKNARGYVLENYGEMLALPERGPIGSDGLANERDFLFPHAAYEDREGDFELLAKLGGKLFSASLKHSPLDVVAWHGKLAPYKYDLYLFNTMGSISYDHPDPSIFTVLTSASGDPGVANVDFVIFPPRWLVMENSFRPPWYHRNIMSEYMGLIHGDYDAKTGGGFTSGGGSLHNCFSAHGPDANTFEMSSAEKLQPQKLGQTMAFMFESRYPMSTTAFARSAPQFQKDYIDCWQSLDRHFKK